MMPFQLLKPEISNIPKTIFLTIAKDWKFWAILIVGAVLLAVFRLFERGTALVIGGLFLLLSVYISRTIAKIRKSFWQSLAKMNNWQYEETGDTAPERGIMFKQGINRSITNIVKGQIDGRPFRIFSYSFTISKGRDKDGLEDKEIYNYAVFEFKFNGNFPHIYLNNTSNRYNLNIGEILPVPGEFAKNFRLYVPRKYEIEALQIFTPEIFAALLDKNLKHDVELVDQELVIFAEGQTNNFETLEKEFNRALELEDLFDEKLDKFKFTPIGDMSYIFGSR